MHELSLMEDLVEQVERQATGARVLRVCLHVGRESGAFPPALAFCFDVCAAGTALEGAALEIVETRGSGLLLKEVEVV